MRIHYSEYISSQFSGKNQPYSRQSMVYVSKETTSNIYFIREGIVNIRYHNPDANKVTKAVLFRGDIFGVLRLFHYESIDDYAEIISPTAQIATMSHGDFFQKINRDEPFNLYVLQSIINRLIQLERRWTLLNGMPVKNRLIAFIVEMSLRQGKQVGSGAQFKNPFTHKEIGAIIGASRQTVTMTFNQLQNEKLIRYNRERVIVRNLEDLQKSIFHK